MVHVVTDAQNDLDGEVWNIQVDPTNETSAAAVEVFNAVQQEVALESLLTLCSRNKCGQFGTR